MLLGYNVKLLYNQVELNGKWFIHCSKQLDFAIVLTAAFNRDYSVVTRRVFKGTKDSF